MRFLIATALSLALLASSGAKAADTRLADQKAVDAKAASERAALAALDGRQKDLVARADLVGLAALSAPDLTINAPTNRVLTREQFLNALANGQIGSETFERTVESVTIAGDIGVVMGREVFTPTPKSELGRTYGERPLKRRYTNVYQRIDGHWKWLARHANVVAEKPAAN